VATAEGLYLDKKLDLLAAYLLVAPASAALAQLKAAAAAWLAAVKQATAAAAGRGAESAGEDSTRAKEQQQQQQQQQQQVKLRSKVSTGSWHSISSPQNSTSDPAAAAAAAVGDGSDAAADLVPFASADLAHQYARLVVRRSLRSQMPGARQVMTKLFTRHTLLVRRGVWRGWISMVWCTGE
jgi:hypothetical protein